jgi:transposase
MFYVGLDIHTKRISVCALGETGQVVQRSQVRSIEEMLHILKNLPDRFEVCYEASCGYGYSHDLLRPLAARVLVAHPGQLRLIFRSKNKNDRNDAERLAKLLYLGETPTVHVPSLEVRTWRELIKCRSQVIAKRTQAKNAVRALLRSAGVVPPKQPGLWTKKGLVWLRQRMLPTPSQQLRRDLLLEEIETLVRQVRRIEQHLNHQAQHRPLSRNYAASLAWGSARPKRWLRSSMTRIAFMLPCSYSGRCPATREIGIRGPIRP